ncbi:hypothetical protein A1O1_07435 [Capronia coronata CBS 617.96]|uniref:Wbp11/ELF5/Saf1 N-terminal domain-containing protein n=1 Tax=Capronia coronata CBS 617.96 TaxID=1182541 RepID=W9XU93_9EURO|nr:uncharacterized protein A1O1_07435 [Capronia coronata CBS 617.96]EXJ83808.1 hypothetical protein A1O1_07435 [Capronia coronata CBS 617.96]
MAKDKERTINPAQQQRKLEKAKQIKKSRAELQAKRNEKLARRNPERIQRQIDDLKALEAAGQIKPREKAILDDLERDLKAIRKAREALGDKAPSFGGGPPQRRRDGDHGNVLGKRRHDGERKPWQRRQDSSGSDTDDSVRRIPMPEDTPPPIPREFRRGFQQADNAHQTINPEVPSRPAPVVKTTYESAPQIRDLRKEAVGRFVPTVVRKKQEAAKGGGFGHLVEPEELDRLEAQGYTRTDRETRAGSGTGSGSSTGTEHAMEVDAAKLAEEEERFLRELGMEAVADEGSHDRDAHEDALAAAETQTPKRNVEVEEVRDEDA